VTVANWAEALRVRYGSSEIVMGDRSVDLDELRATLFVESLSPYSHRTHDSAAMRRIRASAPLRTAEMLIKDLRWAAGGRKSQVPDSHRFATTPYVWQHHNLFHRGGRQLADVLGVPLVHFVDAPHVWESEHWGISRGPLARVVERFGEQPQARGADLVACVSDEVATATVDRLKVPEDRILITPCTVDATRFVRTDSSPLRRELGLDHKVIVGWVGSFRRFHALDLLVEAFDHAAAQSPELHLVLVGSGAVMNEVQRDVETRSLQRRVTFVGSIPNRDIPAYLSLFDIATLPAAAGPFHYSPLKLREYAASGTAIVAADVGDIAETLDDGTEAVIVPPGSAVSLSEAMVALAKDSVRRKSLGSAAQAAAEARFGMQRVLASVESRLGITR
jgi:glycosyltransferase involved in cell wall biosynthesis